MTDVGHQRCINHPPREAAVLCPSCGRPFCKECVAEHDDRILCASCLKKESTLESLAGNRFLILTGPIQFLAGFTLLWLFFYYLAKVLLAIPNSFHEGTVWSELVRMFE